jgi:hypothetical protein
VAVPGAVETNRSRTRVSIKGKITGELIEVLFKDREQQAYASVINISSQARHIGLEASAYLALLTACPFGIIMDDTTESGFPSPSFLAHLAVG